MKAAATPRPPAAPTPPPVQAPPPTQAETPAPAVAPTTPLPAAQTATPSAAPPGDAAAKPSDSAAANTAAHRDSGAPSSSNGTAANGPARATYQPLPDIPDEDRAEAYAAVALARFTVHPDGSADVSLVQATNNPTLNRLLFASLRKWHFTAAMQDGHPVESTLELRVHFNVQ